MERGKLKAGDLAPFDGYTEHEATGHVGFRPRTACRHSADVYEPPDEVLLVADLSALNAP